MRYAAHMIEMIMDGIKDMHMWTGYAMNALEDGRPDMADWFKTKIKDRLEHTKRCWDEVARELEIKRRANDGDVIAAAMMSMIGCRITEIEREYEAI